MSVLTKVFVILVTILSVMLVALIVPFVANTQNFKQMHDEEKAVRMSAERTAALRQGELSAAQQKESELTASLKRQNENLVTQINVLSQNLADAESQALTERAKNSKFEVDLGRLTAANQQYAQITQEVQAELKQRRSKMVDLQTKLIQMSDHNNELQSQLESLTRQVRRIREQTIALQEQNAELEGKLAQLPPDVKTALFAEQTQAAPFVPETPIKGRVTSISKLDDETFVQVNIGTNDGVEQNMKFLVHRSNQFVATLVITTVDSQAAAGRLELLQGDITVGDSVLTGGY